MAAGFSKDWKMQIGGQTKAFAVLGHPIGHTLSPAMHNAAFAALGLDAVYLAFDVKPERLAEVLAAMHAMGFGGANLTVPLKEAALRCLTRLDESAQALGAVNTVRFERDAIVGYNTDGEGFLRAVREAFGREVAGLSLYVLGTGGAGRAVALACAGAGIAAIALSDLDAARCRKLAQELETQYLIGNVRIATTDEERVRAARAADLVVQATPVGMKPGDVSPLPAEAFRPDQMVLDLIYMFPETDFMVKATEAGAKAANGLGMLLHQGARAFEIWTGRDAPVKVMRKALEKAVYRREP